MFSEWPIDRIWEGINETISSHSRRKELSENKLRILFEAKVIATPEQQAAGEQAEEGEQLDDQCFV